MLFTLSGMVTEVREVQSSKADRPMLVALLGMIRLPFAFFITLDENAVFYCQAIVRHVFAIKAPFSHSRI